MKFGIGYFLYELRESADADVESLMPLKRAGEDDDETVILTRARTAREDLRIGKVNHDRATIGRDRAADELVKPEVVGDDHVIDEMRRELLEHAQGRDVEILQRR